MCFLAGPEGYSFGLGGMDGARAYSQGEGRGSWSTDLEDWPSDTHHSLTPQISPDYQEKQRVAQGYSAIFQMEKSEAQGGEGLAIGNRA